MVKYGSLPDGFLKGQAQGTFQGQRVIFDHIYPNQILYTDSI